MITAIIFCWCGKEKEKTLDINKWYSWIENTWTIQEQEIYCGDGILYSYYDFINNKEYEKAYTMKNTPQTFDEFKKSNEFIKKVDIINEIEDKWNGVKQFRVAIASSDGKIWEYSIKKTITWCKIEDISSWKLPSMSFVKNIDEICNLSWNKDRYIFDQKNKNKILVYEYPNLESLIKTWNNIYYSFQKKYGECNPKNQEYIKQYDCNTKEKITLLEGQSTCYGLNKIIYPIDTNNIYILSIIGDWCGVAENYIVTNNKKEKINFSSFTNYSKIATYYPQKITNAYPSCRFETVSENPEKTTITCRYNDGYDIPFVWGEMICGKDKKFNANILTKTIQ